MATGRDSRGGGKSYKMRVKKENIRKIMTWNREIIYNFNNYNPISFLLLSCCYRLYCSYSNSDARCTLERAITMERETTRGNKRPI